MPPKSFKQGHGGIYTLARSLWPLQGKWYRSTLTRAGGAIRTVLPWARPVGRPGLGVEDGPTL